MTARYVDGMHVTLHDLDATTWKAAGTGQVRTAEQFPRWADALEPGSEVGRVHPDAPPRFV